MTQRRKDEQRRKKQQITIGEMQLIYAKGESRKAGEGGRGLNPFRGSLFLSLKGRSCPWWEASREKKDQIMILKISAPRNLDGKTGWGNKGEGKTAAIISQ